MLGNVYETKNPKVVGLVVLEGIFRDHLVQCSAVCWDMMHKTR